MTHSSTLYSAPIPRLVASTSSLKCTNKATPDVVLFLAMAILYTERISEFVDYQLNSLVHSLPSYIKDTAHFLLQLEQMEPLPDNAILVTLNVSSLYTNIPHNEGIEACRHFLNTHTLLGETGGESVNSAGYSLTE